MPIFRWLCYFNCLLIFFAFISISNYWITSTLLNFIRWIAFSHVILIKTHRVLTKWTMLSRWDSPAKNIYLEKNYPHLSEISPILRWDLTWVEWIYSQKINLLLEIEMHNSAWILPKWNTLFFTSYKLPLNFYP